MAIGGACCGGRGRVRLLGRAPPRQRLPGNGRSRCASEVPARPVGKCRPPPATSSQPRAEGSCFSGLGWGYSLEVALCVWQGLAEGWFPLCYPVFATMFRSL